MTSAFLAAVIDTLLPGEAPAPPGATPLPSGTAAGLDLGDGASHRPVLDAIAVQAGGLESFVRADEAARADALKVVERAMPDAFRALLNAVLSDYYESAPVLAALGWRTAPPQPQGHELPRFHEEAARLLERAKRRAKLWRV